MEKLMVAKAAHVRGYENDFLRNPLRQRNGFPWFGHPAFHQPDPGGRALTITDPNMTRFMMTIDDAVDLVCMPLSMAIRAISLSRRPRPRQSRPWPEAMMKLFKANNEIRIIGTRHGEKLYETLLTREEMAKAEDMGDYYRIPADMRDLNYACYFIKGEEKISMEHDYTSDNTERLDVGAMVELLLNLDLIRETLKGGRI